MDTGSAPHEREQPPLEGPAGPVRPVRLRDIFLLFLRIGLISFGGGVTAWTYTEVVERRRWISDRTFWSGLTLAQILPGLNITNLAVYVGQTLQGRVGALVALTALLSGPFFFIIAAAALLARVEHVPLVQAFLSGVAAAAGGLLLSLGARAARPLKGVVPWLVVASIVVTVGVLRWPIVPVLGFLIPVSIGFAWRTRQPGDAQ